MDDLAVDVSDHYPISIVCDIDCEQRIDTDTKDGKVKINWEKVDKECYSEMVNQEILYILGNDLKHLLLSHP
jgi:hypothetical protein